MSGPIQSREAFMRLLDLLPENERQGGEGLLRSIIFKDEISSNCNLDFEFTGTHLTITATSGATTKVFTL